MKFAQTEKFIFIFMHSHIALKEDIYQVKCRLVKLLENPKPTKIREEKRTKKFVYISKNATWIWIEIGLPKPIEANLYGKAY